MNFKVVFFCVRSGVILLFLKLSFVKLFLHCLDSRLSQGRLCIGWSLNWGLEQCVCVSTYLLCMYVVKTLTQRLCHSILTR